jgi:hypothetical protein
VTVREGIRGGNVRSVQEARDLQATFKADLSTRIREAIVAALDRGQYHADDLAALDIPAEHLNCVGSQVALLVRQGVMKKVGMRRNRAAASNARWSGVYEYESNGRKKLVGVDAGVPSSQGTDGSLGPTRECASVDPGERSGVTSHAPEPARLPGFDDAPPSAYDPYSEAA